MSTNPKPNAEQYKALVNMPANLDYPVEQKAFMMFIACECFSTAVSPWKLNALRTVLTTQDAVTQFQTYLKLLAVEQNLTTLDEASLKQQMDAHFINVDNAADWVLAQQQSMPVKFLGRTILMARNYMQQATALDENGDLEVEDDKVSQLLAFPAQWLDKYDEGVQCLPSFAVITPEQDMQGWSKAGWLLNTKAATSGWTGWSTKLKSTVTAEAPQASAPTQAAEPAQPAVINPAAMEGLKTAILTMIKTEVNTLLAADVVAGLVAKQIAQNPLPIQQALVKVFSVGQNPIAAGAFTEAAKTAVDTFMASGGKDYVSQQIQAYMKANVNAQKIEQEAIKGLTSNIDAYFAHIFNRVVVKDGAGNVLGHLGFKDGGTQLKAPMPHNPLAAKLAATDVAAEEESPF